MRRHAFKQVLVCIWFLCAAFAASAMDIFSGRTYRMTKWLSDGIDLMSYMKATGMTYSIQFRFAYDGSFVMEVDTGDSVSDGEGTYRVDEWQQSLVITLDEETVCPYSGNGDVFIWEYTDDEGSTYSIECTDVRFIADDIPMDSDELLDDYSDNEWVDEYTFSGRTYMTTRIFVDGTDYTEVLRGVLSEDDLITLVFEEDQRVIMPGTGEAKYFVDRMRQTVTVYNDDTDEIVFEYFAGGTRLKYASEQNGRILTFYLE